MDKTANSRWKEFYSYLFLWVCLDLVTAYFLGLSGDEAYYWMYSRDLALGYFDHPPMVALLIRIGDAIHHHPLGIRLLGVFAHAVLILVLWNIIPSRRKWDHVKPFFLIASSIPLFHIYGFVMTPDVPLLLTAGSFFLIYSRFRVKETVPRTILLGMAMAAMLYSKYHGILVILLTIIADPGLLKRPYAYLSAFIGLFLFFPHLLWQWENGFPSFLYHLHGRGGTIDYLRVPGFIGIQMLILGGFTIPMLYKGISLGTKSKGLMRVLKFNAIGILVFFTLMSIRGRVEPHWTALVSFPLALLAFQFWIQGKWKYKYLLWSTLPSIFLILIGRGVLISGFFAPKDFRENEEWTREIAEVAEDRKVVVINSYQKASLFSFYQGEDALCINNIDYRRNQYDLWNIERNGFHLRPALLVADYNNNWEKVGKVKGGTRVMKVDEFPIYNDVKVWIDSDSLLDSGEGRKRMKVTIENPYSYSIPLDNEKVILRLGFQKKGDIQAREKAEIKGLSSIPPYSSAKGLVEFNSPELSGEYELMIGMSWSELPGIFVSPTYKLNMAKGGRIRNIW